MKLWIRQPAVPVFRAARRFSSITGRSDRVRIGYVPEHFSTPLYFAQKYFSLPGTLHPYPSGTGHMIQSLQANEIDVGIGLTEGWVGGLGKQGDKAGYKLVGTYVESPLRWAISTGARRNDVTETECLSGKKVGVSRIGSGSYIMSYVLADQYGWLKSSKLPFEPIVLDNFKNLRSAVNKGDADFFMWEHFTTKRYYDNGELKKIGEIYTPWSSWKIVARNPENLKFKELGDSINKGIEYFSNNKDEAVEYISTHLDYSAEDAREWMKTVVFSKDVSGVDMAVVQKTVEILGKAGVLDPQRVDVGKMVTIERRS